ncbi:MAG TPA: hypothetical protein VMS22_09135 [Candidatus Eisenbacteria bacterium]|nr:hypothetical protein [Candidatus Eisenbacteria bacterium]
MNVVLSNCPMGEEGHNGEVVEVDAQVTIGDNGGAISADGFTYADSWTDSSSGNTRHVSWSFQGS